MMDVEKRLLYITAGVVGVAAYLNDTSGSLSYMTPLVMIGMAACKRDDDDLRPSGTIPTGRFMRSGKLSASARSAKVSSESDQAPNIVPMLAAKPLSAFERPSEPSSATETADLPSWAPQPAETVSLPNQVADQIPSAAELKAPIEKDELLAGKPSPTATTPELRNEATPPTVTAVQHAPASTTPAHSNAHTDGARIKKSASGLWKQPSRESWINDAISNRNAGKDHRSAPPPQPAAPTPAASKPKQPIVLWRIPSVVESNQAKSTEDSPNPLEQKLTIKPAAPVVSHDQQARTEKKKSVTNQCNMNLPALKPIAESGGTVPSTASARSELAKFIRSDIQTKLNEGSTEHRDREPQPYAIDWSQSSGAVNTPPSELRPLSTILAPVQPRAHIPEDPWQKHQVQYGVQPVPIARKPQNEGALQPFESIGSQGYTPRTASRIPAAQTLSLPAQVPTATKAEQSQTHQLTMKPTQGAFAKAPTEAAVTTLQLELDVPLFEEPLHESAPPVQPQYTKRGLPHSMVTTQQLKTLPPGNRRAEEYKKALKSNLALQRKCQTLVERLVQERTAKLELLNHELQIARDQAVETAKLRSHFVANISHELRTPLAGILGMTEILRDMNLNEEQGEVAKYIYESAEALMTVVTDLLDFSKLDTGKLELSRAPLSVRDVVEVVANAAMPIAEKKHIDIKTSVEADVPEIVIGDSERVEQVLMHFVNNAAKFTEEGSIRIDASVENQNEEWVVVRFSVSDTGIGISEPNLKKLFNPFVQADGSHTRKYGGTGLGLSISKGLVSLMSGGIGVTSVEGQGSTFAFTIPFQLQQASANLLPISKKQVAS